MCWRLKARTIRELALATGQTVDELLNRLISNQSKEWLTCSLCGVKVRAINMSSHMAKMHHSLLKPTIDNCHYYIVDNKNIQPFSGKFNSIYGS